MTGRKWVGSLIALLLLLGLLLSGCSGGGANDGKKDEPTTDESPDFETIAPPGIYALPDGTTEALGVLTHRDLEGGFWAVVKTPKPEEAQTAEVLAVVVAPEGIDLASMSGRYVSVVGTRNDGPSIFMAGPVLNATSVKVVSDSGVK